MEYKSEMNMKEISWFPVLNTQPHHAKNIESLSVSQTNVSDKAIVFI